MKTFSHVTELEHLAPFIPFYLFLGGGVGMKALNDEIWPNEKEWQLCSKKNMQYLMSEAISKCVNLAGRIKV